MRKSQRLTMREIRAAFRLVGEVRELGGDSIAWKVHMLQSLCQMVGAAVGMTGEWRAGLMTPPIGVVSSRWPSRSDERIWRDHISSREAWQNDEVAVLSNQWRGSRYTRSRLAFMDNASWTRSAARAWLLKLHLDEFIGSNRPLGPAGGASVSTWCVPKAVARPASVNDNS